MNTFEKRPLIGLLGSVNDEKGFRFANSNYWTAVLQSGGYPVLLPYLSSVDDASELLSRLDGVLFLGGDDIHPSHYGQEKLPACGSGSDERDRSEMCYVEAWDRTDLPCLGICRGIQALNVFLGGTLWQDIPSQLPDALPHGGGSTHPVFPESGTLYADLCGGGPLTVNSFHHQAIRDCAPSVCPAARSEDGVIEAVCFKNHPNALAVQYHPERTFETDPSSRALFTWLVRAAGGAR
ncbi:MAG: gamma-glutamyl-gamma-aminobutyrate hydrolase family protein [Clostridia bacterium]|nr:gamma-glutamyl-gamma-aminobutyrate hydrolase family protein [Clostridia bacterium]